MGLLEPSLRRRLQIVQQCRPDDIERVRDQYADARYPGRAHHLYRGHAGQARRRASGHRPRRRLDHRRADRGGPPGDPHSLCRRDRRSPDRQCARDDQGRRRAHDPRGPVHARAAGAADRGDGGAIRSGARQCRGARAVGRPAERRARPRRSGRAGRQQERADRGRAGAHARARPRPLPAGASRHDEGVGHRHRHDPFRRHRRHRHVGDRRGHAPARLSGAGLATSPKAMSSRDCASAASR